ncbi:E3 ubiquitin-protein ligase RNF25-like [Ylistrum balloti]|uniref:E3 ubiquitin-protein ligase RNF25-like n=1 Tax=Ylistrum balloti TaxID=509963 RepID=UPI0029058BAF|nr:E3 ubiquitin-protein ligase RNF25-like [Ylistrum balloti]
MAEEYSLTADDSIIHEELEVLESIYIDELEVDHDHKGHPSSISLQLHPSTGEDVHKKFVCMTLTLNVPIKYPVELPEVLIRNPRGIGEEELESLHEAMNQLAVERRGGHMLYDIIELAKESLTEGNVPHCPCMICLEHFCEGEEFTRTDCYHYFHRHCLYRYVSHCIEAQKNEENQRPKHGEQEEKNEVLCPVCREIIYYDIDLLSLSQGQVKEDDCQYTPSADILKWQVEMAAILEAQRQKGGVIDLEAEKNKFLVTAEDTVQLPRQGPSSELEDITKTNTEAKENKLVLENKAVQNCQSRTQFKNDRHNRADRPRPGSGQRSHRYRGPRNYSQDGHWSSDGRNRGHKTPNNYHQGQGSKRKEDYSYKQSWRRSDQTDVNHGTISPKNEDVDINKNCESTSEIEVESVLRSESRTVAKDDDSKDKQVHNNKTEICDKDLKKENPNHDQKDLDGAVISPRKYTDNQTEQVHVDSVKRKGFPVSESKSSAKFSNNANYRDNESRKSENENSHYYQGRNKERGHSSHGRGQGRSERGRGRGSRRSANQEDHRVSNGKYDRTQDKKERVGMNSKANRTEIQGNNDKGLVYEEIGGREVSCDHKQTNRYSGNGESEYNIENHTESHNSRGDMRRSVETSSEKYGGRFTKARKHLNKDTHERVFESDQKTYDKAKNNLPSSGFKRPPPGFSQVKNVKSHVKIPPGFEKLETSS